VGLPHIVVIDDSEAILAFTRSVLAPHYAVSTAKDGRDGLALCQRTRPEAVLLDLSMPEMDGEQVLARLKADPALEPVPVIVISSEQARAEACLTKGAIAHLVKPVRAEELIGVVGRALAAARARATRGSVAVLALGVGPLDFAIPLADVRQVLLQVPTQPLPGGPSYLAGFFELAGELICVLDLAARFGVDHAVAVIERKLVVIARDGVTLALCVDRVRDPEDIAPGDIQTVTDERAANDVDRVVTIVKTARGAMGLIRPHDLLSRGLLRSVPALVRAVTA
jgi:CheY-like chemotaxis protein/chemotaxis signal transduction protein